MSERLAEQRIESRDAVDPAPVNGSEPLVKLGASLLRFDGPDRTGQPAAEIAAMALSPGSAFAERARQFADFGQFMLQFQQQMEGLGEREQQLAQRLSELEHEERRFRLWANETEAELTERKNALLAQESALAQRMADFERQVRELETAADRLQAERNVLEAERTSLRLDLQRELERDRQTLADERESLNQQQAKVQELGDALLEQHRTQQDRIAEQLRQEREQLWISLTAEWKDQRARYEEERAEFFKDRALLENRLRFQQEHLEKTRAELEREQHQSLRDRQIGRERLEAAERQLTLRRSQLDRYRAVLEELDRALERESALTSRMTEAMSDTARQEQQQSLFERQAWEDERRNQQAELRRQQEMLLTRTEQLETRRLRLEALRREVEQTSHAAMELRFAVEEVWSQLQQSLGLAVTQDKVEQARREIVRDYEQWQARLTEQRQEFNAAERSLEQQRLAFQEERRTLTEWISARDQELLRQERVQLHQTAAQVTADEARRLIQERWLREKDEAERVIRSLLRDLMEQAARLPEPDASALAG